MRYVTVRQDGVVEIRFDSSEALPVGAVEVSVEEYDALINGGLVFINGQVAIPPPPPAPDPSILINAQIDALESQFTETVKMRAILGDQSAIATVQGLLSQIDALKAQL